MGPGGDGGCGTADGGGVRDAAADERPLVLRSATTALCRSCGAVSLLCWASCSNFSGRIVRSENRYERYSIRGRRVLRDPEICAWYQRGRRRTGQAIAGALIYCPSLGTNRDRGTPGSRLMQADNGRRRTVCARDGKRPGTAIAATHVPGGVAKAVIHGVGRGTRLQLRLGGFD